MNSITFYALGSVSIVSLISLSGVVAIPVKRSTLNLVVFFLLALATGAMLGNALVNLVPESFEHTSASNVWVLGLIGLAFCYVLQNVLNLGCHHSANGHCRLEHCACEAQAACNESFLCEAGGKLRQLFNSIGAPVAVLAAYQGALALQLPQEFISPALIAAVLVWFGIVKVLKVRAARATGDSQSHEHLGHDHDHDHGQQHDHEHDHDHDRNAPAGHIHATGWMSLVSHGMDNLMDGILIGVAYQISTEVGIATTIAIVLHEIPMEFGGFGVLINAGFSRWGAIGVNFGSALVATAGTALTLWLGTWVQGLSAWMTPICALIVLHITLSGLMPQLQREIRLRQSLIQFVVILAGFLAVYGAHLFFPE